MQLIVTCKACGLSVTVPGRSIGNRISCKKCTALLPVPMERFPEGTIIGKFTVCHLLGKGGMAEVYLATQDQAPREVALKVLTRQAAKQQDNKARFRQEAAALARMDHPNIVTCLEHGVDDEFYYIAIGYVNGRDLNQLVKDDGPMHEKNALAVIHQVAVALEYAWTTFQLLHRDLKPENVMLTSSGDAYLMDLGLAKGSGLTGDLTQTGRAMGTPAYMSPEQVKSAKNVDLRSDVYSLGATLYHLIGGRKPYDGESPGATLMAVLGEDPTPLNELCSNASAGCLELVRRMMARKPDDRQQDWDEVVRDVEAVMQGGAPVSRKASEVVSVEKNASHRPLVIIAVAVVGMCLIAFLLLR